MRQWLAIGVTCICTGIVAPHAIARDAAPAMAAQGTLQAAFAPWDDVEGVIIDEIAGARRQVLVQAYLLTSKKIANALIAAYRRGARIGRCGTTLQNRIVNAAGLGSYRHSSVAGDEISKCPQQDCRD